MDIRLMISDGTVGQGGSMDWEWLEEGFLHRFSPSSKGYNWERFYIAEGLVHRQNIGAFFAHLKLKYITNISFFIQQMSHLVSL